MERPLDGVVLVVDVVKVVEMLLLLLLSVVVLAVVEVTLERNESRRRSWALFPYLVLEDVLLVVVDAVVDVVNVVLPAVVLLDVDVVDVVDVVGSGLSEEEASNRIGNDLSHVRLGTRRLDFSTCFLTRRIDIVASIDTLGNITGRQVQMDRTDIKCRTVVSRESFATITFTIDAS